MSLNQSHKKRSSDNIWPITISTLIKSFKKVGFNKKPIEITKICKNLQGKTLFPIPDYNFKMHVELVIHYCPTLLL